MDILKIKDLEVPYKIIHKRIKNIYYRFKDNILVISSPYLVSTKTILDGIYKREEEFYKFISHNRPKDIFELKDGMNVKLLEQDYQVIFSDKTIILEDKIYLNSNNLKASFYESLKYLLYQYCTEKTDTFYDLMYKDYKYPSISFKLTKTYHAQYNIKKHQITFNIALAFLKKEYIDEVIIHELCHIKYMNHSDNFHKLLDKYCPNNKEIRKKINKEWIKLC